MSKNTSKNLLNHYRIKSPCQQSWGGMMPEEQGRFCLSCEKSVHDLSNMTQKDAFTFLEDADSPCVRYTTAPDGAIQFQSPMQSRSSDLMGRWREYMARSAVVASLLLAGCDDLTSSNSAPSAEIVDGASSSADIGLTQDTIDRNTLASPDTLPSKTVTITMGKVAPVLMGEMERAPPVGEVLMGDIEPLPAPGE